MTSTYLPCQEVPLSQPPARRALRLNFNVVMSLVILTFNSQIKISHQSVATQLHYHSSPRHAAWRLIAVLEARGVVRGVSATRRRLATPYCTAEDPWLSACALRDIRPARHCRNCPASCIHRDDAWRNKFIMNVTISNSYPTSSSTFAARLRSICTQLVCGHFMYGTQNYRDGV